MRSDVLQWPVCGVCCEVAPYSWLGEPHRCAQDRVSGGSEFQGVRSVSPYGPIAIRAGNFAHCLEAAITHGDRIGDDSTGLDTETRAAISAVAAEFPDVGVATIASAYEAFARDIRGIHFNESRAVFRACGDGVIAQREEQPRQALDPDCDGSPRSTYRAHSITVIDPDPVAAREWILTNRANPSEMYRRYVLEGRWPRTCEPPRSYVVGVDF